MLTSRVKHYVDQDPALQHPLEEPVPLLAYGEPRNKPEINLKSVNALFCVKFREAKAETVNGVLKAYMKYTAKA